MKKYVPLLVTALCVVLSAAGSVKGQKRLLFHAGAGQRSSLDEIGQRYQKSHPDVKIDFSYKGSGYFLADLTLAKEGDVYMPGEEFYLLQANERGFVADYDPGKDIPAYFVTVIITPKGNPRAVRSVRDFAKPGVRVGLGDPQACAIGMWHENTFKKAGIWEAVKKNAAMNAKCIPELGNACQLKAIDATIVWATTAILYLKSVEIVPIEPELRGLVKLPVATLTFSKHPQEAKAFKDFILSDEARRVFHSHAYCIDPDKVDEDMQWLVKAVAVVNDPSMAITAETVGPYVEEVKRQRERKR